MEKISRKSQFDSLLKKTKAKVFKTIHEVLKKCLIAGYKLNRLPQSFITNIKIDFNKIYLQKTVLEMYQENELITDIEEFFEKNYVKSDREQIFKDFLNLSFKDVYEYYISSNQYTKDREKVKLKEGEKFSILFSFIAQNFIEYYLQSKGNKPKKLKPAKTLPQIPKIYSNNFSNDNDKKTLFKVMNK
jgi:predicted glutamine amidotransferase